MTFTLFCWTKVRGRFHWNTSKFHGWPGFWVRNYKQIPVSGLNSHFNVEDFSNFIMAPTVFGSFKRWIGWKNPLETKDPFESLVPWNQLFFSMPRLSSRCQEISRHTRQNRGNMSCAMLSFWRCDLQFLWESDLAPAHETLWRKVNKKDAQTSNELKTCIKTLGVKDLSQHKQYNKRTVLIIGATIWMRFLHHSTFPFN